MKHFEKITAIVTIFVLTFFVIPGLAAEKAGTGSFLGVRLIPVPELLQVHLGLGQGAGQLVVNVVKDSPADKAGLERYDVITQIDGKQPAGYDEFVNTIQSAGAGAKIKLTVISKGKEKVLEVTLGAPPEAEPVWKYEKTPFGPGRSQEPQEGGGRYYQIEPFDERELPFKLPEELRRFFRREYRFEPGPNDKGLILPPREDQQRLDELEKRLEELQKQQEQILEKLQKLLEEKQ